MVREVDCVEDFQKELKDAGNKLVVVDFTAEWCGPCKRMGPFFVTLSTDPQFADVVFLKVDVDAAEDVSQLCKISCMPTFQFYKNGKMVEEMSGANENKLRELVTKHL